MKHAKNSHTFFIAYSYSYQYVIVAKTPGMCQVEAHGYAGRRRLLAHWRRAGVHHAVPLQQGKVAFSPDRVTLLLENESFSVDSVTFSIKNDSFSSDSNSLGGDQGDGVYFVGISPFKPSGLNYGSEGDPDGSKGDPDGSKGDPDGPEGDPDGSKGDPDGPEGDPDGSKGDPDGSEGDPDEK
jgi:hypothetical protein